MPATSKAGAAAGEAPAPAGVSLRRDFLWTLLGNGIYAVSQWAIIVMLAKWSGPEVVGFYSFAVAVATPLVTFATFQLRSVQVTDVGGEHRFSDYLGFRLLSMLGALAVLTGVCLALHYAPSTTALVEVLGLALAVEAVSDVYYGRMQSHHRMDSIAKSMMLRGVLSTGVLIGVVVLTRSLLLGVLAMVATRTLVLWGFDAQDGLTLAPVPVRPSDQGRRPRWHWRTQAALLKTTLPIGLVSVLVALNTSIPRYFLQWSSGARELGIFAALAFFQSSGNMVVGARGTAPRGRGAGGDGRPGRRGGFGLLGKLLALGAAFGLAGFLVAALAGRQLRTLLFRREYAARADVLKYLMVAAGLGYCCQFIGTAVTAARIFRPQIALFVTVATSLTGLCYLLVPGHGAVGAISAIVGATVVQILGFAFLLFWCTRPGREPAAAFVPAREELAVSGSAH